jgi:Spy/CpxP family protein refolding chaperone
MRNWNMHQLVSMSLGLVLALTLSVASSAQTSSPQTAPSAQTPEATPSPETPQTEPSQQSPAATPAPAPQQATPNPSTAPSQSAPPAGGQQSNQSGSIDEELQLTPDQKQKIAAVVDDENKQISAVRDDNSMSLEQKQQKVMQIRQAGTPKIKAILTPEQLQKLAVIQERMRQQNSQSGSRNGNQGTTQAPPQR